MVESITYLIAFAIVLVAFDKIINDIKKEITALCSHHKAVKNK